MLIHEKINYIEFPAKDLEKTKRFFTAVFDWQFTDYGPDYIAFDNAGIDGGFYKAETVATSAGVLIVFYSKHLDQTRSKIEAAGGYINKPTYAFPGGHRFHFTDPNGNEYAVWSDCYAQ